MSFGNGVCGRKCDGVVKFARYVMSLSFSRRKSVISGRLNRPLPCRAGFQFGALGGAGDAGASIVFFFLALIGRRSEPLSVRRSCGSRGDMYTSAGVQYARK